MARRVGQAYGQTARDCETGRGQHGVATGNRGGAPGLEVPGV